MLNITFERLYLKMQPLPFSFFNDQASWKNKDTIKTIWQLKSQRRNSSFILLTNFLTYKQVGGEEGGGEEKMK